jgi:hypothetical protein
MRVASIANADAISGQRMSATRASALETLYRNGVVVILDISRL